MANYLARITDTAIVESKNSKTPSVKLSLDILNDLDTGAEIMGRRIYADLWLTEKTIDNTAKTLAEIGCPCENFEDLNFGNPMGGIEVEISTDFEEYNGKEYEKVAFVNPVGHYANRGMKRADDSVAKQVSKKFNAVLKAAKKKQTDKEADSMPF